MTLNQRTTSLLLLAVLTAPACQTGVRGGRYIAFDTATARPVELADMAERMAGADVVFLGEEHDNDVGHKVQFWTTRMLHAHRPGVILSMEMFEADVQETLDAYLAGEIDERTFLENSRPWGNYFEHYRPAVEWAKANGVPVVAANIPRPLARSVSRGHASRVVGDRHAPWGLTVDEPSYRARFEEAMGGHGDGADKSLDNWFAAQCIKDDRMAESIIDALEQYEDDDPLVVHWCGRFHSDRGEGTVSRMLRRRPGLDVKVVSMSSGERLGRTLEESERASGAYVIRVP
ncbi:MAG: hypothetical protein CMJ84_01385 [Planctomycetes bacterium]|jgi:uncharacterized iron-regulated protein|nr:hypothetical protein [Planctomycetota bacterium]